MDVYIETLAKSRPSLYNLEGWRKEKIIIWYVCGPAESDAPRPQREQHREARLECPPGAEDRALRQKRVDGIDSLRAEPRLAYCRK